MAPLKINIVGAGIGGAAAAIGLVRNGHSVVLWERLSFTNSIGFAFRITPNSDRCLKYLGIDTIAAGAVSANTGKLFDADGKPIRVMVENEDKKQVKRGVSVFVLRHQLHEQLMLKARSSGVEVKTGVKVKSVDVNNTKIVLEDGQLVSGDIVIGSDGVHSIVRPHVVDDARFHPRPSTGHNALRFMISKDVAQKDEILSSLIQDDVRFFSWSGYDKRILVYPVDYGKELNITCTHPEGLSDGKVLESGDAEAIAYNKKVPFETVRSIYQEFDPLARRILELADPDGFRVWKLLDMDDVPTWSSNHTVLLGDAGHATSPFGFSGASMAIEDAVTLATVLSPDLLLEQVKGRLKLYETIRKPRVGVVRETSRKIARGEDGVDTMMPYMGFLGPHDAVAHAKEELLKYQEKQEA